MVVFSHHSSLSSFLSLTETHSFKKMEFQPAEAKKFFSTVRKEMALLATSLPDGIMVKTFEDRMVGFLSLMPAKVKQCMLLLSFFRFKLFCFS